MCNAEGDIGMSEVVKGVTVLEYPPTVYPPMVERFYSDGEILDLFGDEDGSLVNKLLHRAQEAEAIVDNLDKTKDGMPVTGKEILYCKHGHPVNRRPCTEHGWICFQEPCTDYTYTCEDGVKVTLEDARYLSAEQCYSTKAAALKAKEIK